MDASQRRIIAVDDADALARTAAARLLMRMADNEGRIAICLTGGSGPTKLYELLATESYRGKIPWPRVHCFIGDERFVRPADPLNNMSAARRIFLDACAPAANIHPIQTDTANPDESAASCPSDCPSVCGDGFCSGDENGTTCPQDCRTGICGDGVCDFDLGEDCNTCRLDCPLC